MKLKEIIHEKLQEKALDKAIEKLVGPWGNYYISEFDGDICFNFDSSKLRLLENIEFNLPSIDDIRELAKKYYKNFDDSWMKNIDYCFKYRNKSPIYNDNVKPKLKLIAKDSNIYLCYTTYNSVDIKSNGDIHLTDCNFENDVKINSKAIMVHSGLTSINGSHKLKADYIELTNVYLLSKNLDIDSKLISFNDSKFWYVNNAIIKAEMIDLNNSKLEAKNKIEIINPNCEKIKGVDAPIIIYNGQDITYSDGILMPKLMKNLIDVLKQVKINITNDIDSKIQESTKKQKENLENKPIIKIYKKKVR